MSSYPATYADKNGTVETVIHNDGDELRLVIRGVQFTGIDFDMLEPVDATPEQRKDFPLFHDCLCSFTLTCQMPMPVQNGTQLVEGTLSMKLILGDPAERGAISREDLWLTLDYADQHYASTKPEGFFENALEDIQHQLPDGVYMKACINCLYADYSVFGNGLFGHMYCFRKLKDKYLAVKSKSNYVALCQGGDAGDIEQVQETWLCPEFKRHVPGVGYR